MDVQHPRSQNLQERVAGIVVFESAFLSSSNFIRLVAHFRGLCSSAAS